MIITRPNFMRGCVGSWGYRGGGSVAVSGTVQDRSGYGGHGTLIGNSYVDSVGMHFDGSGDYVTATIPALGSGDFSIFGWFYITATNDRSLFGFNSDNSGGIGILADAGTKRRVYSGWSILMNISGAFPLYAWTHIGLTRISSTLILYQNTGVVASTANSTNLTNTNFQIGKMLYETYSGVSNDIRIYRRGLSAEEIAQYYYLTKDFYN